MAATVMIHQSPAFPLFPAHRRHTPPPPAPARRYVTSSDKCTVSGGRFVASRCGQWGVHAHTMLCTLSGTQPCAETSHLTPHHLTDRSSSLPQAPSCDDQMKWQRKFLTQCLARSPVNKRWPPSIDLHGWKGRPKIQSQDSYSIVHLFSLQMFAEYHMPGTLLGVEYTPRKYTHL